MVAAAESLLAGGTRNFCAVVCRRRGAQQHWRQNRRRCSTRFALPRQWRAHGKSPCPWVQRRSSLRLTARGKLAHSAYPELGHSAIHALLDACATFVRSLCPAIRFLAKPLSMSARSPAGALPMLSPTRPAPKSCSVSGRTQASSVRKWLARHPCTTSRHAKFSIFPRFVWPARWLAHHGCWPSLTDIPSFDGTWGQPFLIGPGSIHVAHTAEERIPKTE